MVGCGNGDADARTDIDRDLTELDRSFEIAMELARPLLDLGLRPGWKEHGELVPPESGDQTVVADRGAETVRDLDEQLVAGVVAERVVHLLEPVEVDQEHGAGLGVPDGPAGLIPEPATVRQAGQWVMRGEVLERVGLLPELAEELHVLERDVCEGEHALEQRAGAFVERSTTPAGDREDQALAVRMRSFRGEGLTHGSVHDELVLPCDRPRGGRVRVRAGVGDAEDRFHREASILEGPAAALSAAPDDQAR